MHVIGIVSPCVNLYIDLLGEPFSRRSFQQQPPLDLFLLVIFSSFIYKSLWNRTKIIPETCIHRVTELNGMHKENVIMKSLE